MSAPANDLAAKIAAKCHPHQWSHAARLVLAKEIAAELAPTLDALAAAQREAKLYREMREVVAANGFDSITAAVTAAALPGIAEANHNAEVMAKVADNATAHAKELQAKLSRAEADCAALRLAIQEAITEARCLEASTDPLVDQILTPALQATDAGKPLLDELARLRAEVGDRKQSEHLLLQSIAFQEQRAEAAESALRLAKEDGERLDWLEENLGRVVPGSGDARYWILGQKEFAPNKATNLRAAIDAARQKLPEEPKP